MLKKILLLLIFSAGLLCQNQIKSIKINRTNSPVVDGIISEKEWAESEIADKFIQRQPDEGKPANQNTEAYFLYDNDYLFVGIKCYDNPELIGKNFSTKDNQGSADYICLILDTFHDHINSYFFGLTATGTKVDGRYTNDNSYSTNWDGVWWGESKITEYGWSAEFKIPFNSIQFNPDSEIWGMNIFREVMRTREISFWQYISRDDQMRVSKMGHIEGFRDIKPGNNIQILPFVTSAFRNDRTDSFHYENKNGITGIDIKYGITPNMNLSLTANPDFAQIEADDDKINLSRYPLYLNEKRPFFLEGGENFFTSGSESGSTLFYSRRINEPVYGFKLTGKIDNWNIGILNSYNKRDVGIENRKNQGLLDANFDDRALYTVVRAGRDIMKNSQIGMLFITKDYSGKFSRIAALDAKINFADFYSVMFEGAASITERNDNDNLFFNFSFNRKADVFSFGINYSEQGKDFDGNQAGFFNYNNYRKTTLNIKVNPRIEKYGIRQIYMSTYLYASNFQNSNFFDYSSLSRSADFSIMFINMDYWSLRFETTTGLSFDRFDNKLYDDTEYSISFDNNRNSFFYFNAGHRQGSYRIGYQWNYYLNTLLKPFSQTNLGFDYERSSIKLYNPLRTDENLFQIYRAKVYYYINRDLNLRLIMQYNENEKRLGNNFLITYNFQPGCSFYLAYNENYDRNEYTDDRGIKHYPEFGLSGRILQLKISYLFRM